MKKTRRTGKVGEMLRDTLAEIFRRDMKDMNLGFVSIHDIEVSPDLRVARVYMTGLDEAETKSAVDELQLRRSRIRSLLGQRIHLRYTPELEFKYDETAMRASRIESILREVLPPAEPEGEPADADDSDDLRK